MSLRHRRRQPGGKRPIDKLTQLYLGIFSETLLLAAEFLLFGAQFFLFDAQAFLLSGQARHLPAQFRHGLFEPGFSRLPQIIDDVVIVGIIIGPVEPYLGRRNRPLRFLPGERADTTAERTLLTAEFALLAAEFALSLAQLALLAPEIFLHSKQLACLGQHGRIGDQIRRTTALEHDRPAGNSTMDRRQQVMRQATRPHHLMTIARQDREAVFGRGR
jgi:hypothetical protein